VLYRLYPPSLTETPDAPGMARRRLEEMGPVSRDEWIMLGTFVLLLLLWIFGRSLNVHSTVAAVAGLGILLATRVLSWEDVLGERGAWDTFVWLSVLVMMASYLGKLGMVAWFSGSVGGFLPGSSWPATFLLLCLVYFYSHYFFAGNTAHISSMYAAFLAVAMGAGVPPLLAALTLAFLSNLSGGLTHFGTGPAPVLFGAGYVRLADWWRLGAVVSVVNVLIWLGIGGAWWKITGLW
jgi:DASS family divalent anion:Na+ symporter